MQSLSRDVTPFFYSLGIVSTFVILGALLADVIDADELASGRRREGMFGAAASMIMKSVGAFATGASGFLIAWTGFDAAKGVLLLACFLSSTATRSRKSASRKSKRKFAAARPLQPIDRKTQNPRNHPETSLMF